MVHVRLLGAPSIEGDDGTPISLRGQKAWAVLARLVLAERPVPRRELAAELFPDTIDPLGSLRWCLAAIRKALGSSEAFVGDPVDHRLPAGTTVDVVEVLAGRLPDGPLGDLLEGVDPQAGPELATWLLVARQQVASRVDALLREQAIAALSRREHDRAIAVAERLVRRDPYDEGAHVLLVRGLAAAGREDAALAHVEALDATFRRELGVPPSDAVRSAARARPADAPLGVSAGAQAGTLVEAGRAALAAGAIDAGLDCLRQATACAERAGDRSLQAEALLALGTALVRSARGYDDEGSILLDQAATIAAEAGAPGTASLALAERGYADALAGRRPSAAQHLLAAAELAEGDPALLAAVEAADGFNLADWGRGDEALARYEASAEHAARAGDDRRRGWVLGLGAWALVQDGRTDEARRWSDDCTAVLETLQWTSFAPLVTAIAAEVALREGRAGSVDDLERSFAMSCQLGDPCWEGATARALALQAAAAGADDDAIRWIGAARTRSVRTTDTWAGLVGTILVTEAELHARVGEPAAAGAAARDALAVAARAHLDGLLPRAMALVARDRAAVEAPAG